MSKQIFLTGIVDQWMAEDLRFNLMNSSEPVIDIYISCFGGNVNKGFEIANLIQAIQAGGKTEINTFNLSHADSIATVIFLAAKKENRHAVDSSTLFVHEPRVLSMGESTKEDMEKLGGELEMQANRMADFYVKNIDGLSKDEALSLMNQEKNLDANTMLELGIISEVVPNFEIAAQRNLISNLNNSNMSLFKTKQAIFALKMEDDSILVHEGELKVGSEVQKDGVLDSLEGDHIDAEGRTIKVDAENKVTDIVPKEVDAPVVPVVEESVVEEVAALLVDHQTKMETLIDSKIAALRKEGSSAIVPKVDAVVTTAVIASTQASARKGVKAMMDEIAAKKVEQRQAN